MENRTARNLSAFGGQLKPPVMLVVMGVSGSGKTTVAAQLAAAMGWEYVEGDDLHPHENVEKMSHGIALTDADRFPWLDRIAAVVAGWRAAGKSGVVTCSALKRIYRDRITGGRHDVTIVYMQGAHDLIARRMAARHEHFMPLGLLDSQFATLEEPGEAEHALVVPVSGTTQDQVAFILSALVQRQKETRA